MKKITQGEWKVKFDGLKYKIYSYGTYIAKLYGLSSNEAEIDSQAICKAVNNTYGFRSKEFPNGIDPEEIEGLIDVINMIKRVLERVSPKSHKDEIGSISGALDAIKLEGES